MDERVKNYRVLQDLELPGLTPFAAFAWPNGSGKSTIFDVLAFLLEAFTSSLRQAVKNRLGFHELRTRGQTGQ
jgi:predicted ATPase